MNLSKSFIILIMLVSIALLKAQDSETASHETNVTIDVSTPLMESIGDEQTDSSDSTKETSSESSSEATTDDSSDSSTIEVMFEESLSSEEHNSSEPLEESNKTVSENTMASEFSGFDYKHSLNGSDFSCFGRSFGQYADVNSDCRVFHLCYPFFSSTNDELLYQRITFLCDGESVFDQKRFLCVENSTIDHKCSESPLLYQTTNQEYLIKVFSQNVSPIDEVNGVDIDSTEDSSSSPSPSWFNWLYSN